MLSQERLKELLHYNPETGVFTWKTNRRGGAFAGRKAGYLRKDGYIFIVVSECGMLAHRLAFLYMTGSVPQVVDHDNRCKSDNRWNNLNMGNQSNNLKNSKLSLTNTSGMVGVRYDKVREKWHAQIGVSGQQINLGRFDTLLDAAAARKSAELKYNFHENHGRN